MADRVELQGPWPATAPRGTCIISRFDDPVHGSRLHIDHADPSVVIAAELLDDIAQGERAMGNLPGVSLRDGVLRIEAENRTVIYRIGEYHAAIHGYTAEWPD